jgi:DNA-binding transcriptional MerR regulator
VKNAMDNAMNNANLESSQKAYWSKDIADLLEISTSNLRRWSIDLENAGYLFCRDEHNRRAYLEKDIMPLRKLKEFLGNNMSKNDAIKAVISMFPQDLTSELTLPVNDDIVRFSKRELQEVINDVVRKAIEEEREAMFQAFEYKMNDLVEKRDRMLVQQLNRSLEEKQLEIAAAKEQESVRPKKSWWRFLFK